MICRFLFEGVTKDYSRHRVHYQPSSLKVAWYQGLLDPSSNSPYTVNMEDLETMYILSVMNVDSDVRGEYHVVITVDGTFQLMHLGINGNHGYPSRSATEAPKVA